MKVAAAIAAEHGLRLPFAATGTFLAAVLIIAFTVTEARLVRVSSWLVALAAPLALRWWVTRRVPESADAGATWRLTVCRLTFALHGLLWSVGHLWLGVPNDVVGLTVFAFAVGGVSASSLASTAFDLPAALLFAATAAVPFVVRLVMSETAGARALAAMLGVFMAYMTVHGIRINRQHRENQTLKETLSARVREIEARLRAVFDHSPVALTLLDLTSGRFSEVNEASLRLFGFTREELLHMHPRDLGAWDDEDKARQALERLRETPRLHHWETSLKRKDGTRFDASMNFETFDLDGRAMRLASIEDVTERHALEARALKTQKMEMIGQLAGGVAHDFNNVLTVISGTTELALDAPSIDASVRDTLQTIQSAASRAAALTTRLLAFARQQVLQPTIVDLNDLVRDLARMTRGVVGDRVVVVLVPSPSPTTVVADRSSLEQVLLNLALNARDAMPGGGTLTLVVREAADGVPAGTSLVHGRYARLDVSDTGIGMSAETRARIFDPFFTTKPAGQGTGLGLATALGAVAQIGGDITVDTVPDGGTTFSIHLPASAGRPEPQPALVVDMLRGKESILVVDDDQSVRVLLARALQHAGYDVLVADGGAAALSLLEARGGVVDLVVTDVMMPGMSGRDFIAVAKARYPSLCVLFTSGYAENVVAHQGVVDAGIQFLAKPYSMHAVTRRVRDVLDARTGVSGRPTSTSSLGP